MDAEFNAGNLYEINKKLMDSVSPLDPVELQEKFFNMADKIKTSAYYMLLSNEKRDYTVFNISKWADKDAIIREIQETLFNRGLITSVDEQKDGSWEIWIRDIATDENIVYYLFNYDYGVVEVE